MNRILYTNNSRQNNDTPGVQFPDNIMSADYAENLSQFKEIVNGKFKGTTFEDGKGLLPRYPTEQYQLRDNRLSDREVLEIAASKIDTETMSSAEVDDLKETTELRKERKHTAQVLKQHLEIC